MRKAILSSLAAFFLISNAWGQMVLKVDDATYFTGTADNLLTISLTNDTNVTVLQLDLTFDPDCFTIDPASLTKTDRSADLNIFQASNPAPGVIKLAATGIGTCIAPGDGPIIQFSVDVAEECEAGQYVFDLSISISTDPYWPYYSFDIVDGTITVEIYIFEAMLSINDTTFFHYSKNNEMYLTLLNNVPVAGFQADVLFDTTCFKITDASRVGRNPGDIFNWSQIDGGIRIVNATVGQEIPPGADPVVKLFVDVGNCVEGDYLWDITHSIVADLNANVIPTQVIDGTLTIIFGFKGDINDDGTVNALDVILAIRIAIGLNPDPSERELQAADCNLDGQVDVVDVMGIVNIITGLGICLPLN